MLRTLLSIFLLNFVHYSSADVCNVTALSSVNVWGHTEHHLGAEVYENVNFHTLEHLKEIDVTRANVTELCDRMIRYFPKLETLSMISVNLSTINVNAFHDVPKLEKLSLSVNHLSKIRKGAFNNLPNLKILYLSKNKIDFIEDDAFSTLPALEAIHLDRNQITSLNGNLFKGCTKIGLVNFSFNQIKQIQDNSFDDLKPEHKGLLNIKLNSNRINSFSASSLTYLVPVELHLENNELDEIDDIFLNSKADSKLYFNNNKIKCIKDTVTDEMRDSSKFLIIKNNPITCDCVKRIDDILGDEIYGTGEIIMDVDCIPLVSFD